MDAKSTAKSIRIVTQKVSDKTMKKYVKMADKFRRFCQKVGIPYCMISFIGKTGEEDYTHMNVGDIKENSMADLVIWG